MLDIATRVTQISGVSPLDVPARIFQDAEPGVLKGLVAGWPSVLAAGAGGRELLGYFRARRADRSVLAFRGGSGSGGRYFYNDDLSGFNFERITTRLGDLLDRLEDAGGAGDHLYLGSTPVDECFPGFRDENDIGFGAANPAVSIWMGNRSRIAAHFDVPENVACIVAGRRRFTLFPPDQLANLYVGPLDFTPAGQAISLVDFADPDYERYPRFRRALAAARLAELEPGDALYIPSMWWHHVEALDSLNVLVNYWWSTGRRGTGNPLYALIHALLGIKDLSAVQRRAWRGIFEHYVFGDDEASAHIPENARGVLGDMDEATARQLRAMLRDKLAGR